MLLDLQQALLIESWESQRTHSQRVIRPSLHSRVIDHNNAFPPRYPAYSSDNTRSGY